MLLVKKVANKLKKIYAENRAIFTVIKIVRNSLKNRQTVGEKSGKMIILVGGELQNKGAQAMIFAVVALAKQLCPNKRCCVFSALDQVSDYNNLFNIYFWPLHLRLSLLSKKIAALFPKAHGAKVDVENVLENACMIVDISGYALGDAWGLCSLFYLSNIAVAAKYKIPYVIFPQSIGPFQYPIYFRAQTYFALKTVLQYPEHIYVRESRGVYDVKRFTKGNVSLSPDLVLTSDSPTAGDLFCDANMTSCIKLEQSSVILIPNRQIRRVVGADGVLSIYMRALDQLLLEKERNIYVLVHSSDDQDLCAELVNKYLGVKQLKLLDENLNCMEIEKIICQADFIVASRYHAVVHAYKNIIPAVVLGWAIKYEELCSISNQSAYCLNLSRKEALEDVPSVISKMQSNWIIEKEQIKKGVMQAKKDTNDELSKWFKKLM